LDVNFHEVKEGCVPVELEFETVKVGDVGDSYVNHEYLVKCGSPTVYSWRVDVKFGRGRLSTHDKRGYAKEEHYNEEHAHEFYT